MPKKKLAKLGIIVSIVAILLLVSTISHFAFSHFEMERIKNKYQSCVYVETECINTYRSGSGEKSIVIIPDFDVLVPFVEYRPLVDELSLEYDVLLIEPFGKGLSDITKNKRTIDTIIEEYHSVIRQSGVSEPYILMTSGYGSLYAQSYLDMYKEEVEAYIGIDPVPPTQINHFSYKPKSYVSTVFEKLGLVRVAATMLPDLVIPSRYLNNYSSTQRKTMYQIGSVIYGNKNIVEEGHEINDMMRNLQSVSLPSQVPTLFFLTVSDIEKYNWWLADQEELLKDVTINKIRISRSYQYMHRTSYHEISLYLTSFMKEIEYEQNK